MADYVDPRTIKPVSNRLVGEALEAINDGMVKTGVAVEDATDEATAVTQLNALLASLRASGAIAVE